MGSKVLATTGRIADCIKVMPPNMPPMETVLIIDAGFIVGMVQVGLSIPKPKASEHSLLAMT